MICLVWGGGKSLFRCLVYMRSLPPGFYNFSHLFVSLPPSTGIKSITPHFKMVLFILWEFYEIYFNHLHSVPQSPPRLSSASLPIRCHRHPPFLPHTTNQTPGVRFVFADGSWVWDSLWRMEYTKWCSSAENWLSLIRGNRVPTAPWLGMGLHAPFPPFRAGVLSGLSLVRSGAHCCHLWVCMCSSTPFPWIHLPPLTLRLLLPLSHRDLWALMGWGELPFRSP